MTMFQQTKLKNTFAFTGGLSGSWKITGLRPVVGEVLPIVPFLSIVPDVTLNTVSGEWVLRGQISNLRYTGREEKEALTTVQADLGRPEATMAALIPIKKSEEWWAMAQDERLAIFAEQSRHTAIGLNYLPGVARKLYHSRDLGEPFDFLTWFEYSPEHARAFEELVGRLRMTREWAYVTREVDIRLIKA